MNESSHQKPKRTSVLLFYIVAGLCSVATPLITSLVVIVHRSMPDLGHIFAPILLFNLSAIIVGIVSLLGIWRSGQHSLMWLPQTGVRLSGFCAGVALLLYLLLGIRWIC